MHIITLKYAFDAYLIMSQNESPRTLTKLELALIELKKLTPKELNQPQRTIAKMIGHSLGTTQRALKFLGSESQGDSKIKGNGGSKKIASLYSSTGNGTPDTPPIGSFIKIDDDTIESAILMLLNSGKVDSQLIKTMIEFYHKIRGKEDKIRDDIDLEEFRKIGKTLENSD
jgi:hypothetical protein